MIRINLLGVPKTKGRKRAATAVSVPGEGSSTVVLVVAFIGILAVVIAGSYFFVGREHSRLEREWTKANQENMRLAEVKAKYEASVKKADMYNRRIKVIDDLKEAQKGPVDFLNLVADTVNKTDAVWLEAMTDDGKSIDFTGMALSADAVADLMANLRKTGAFRTVEIKETSQDPAIKQVQAFKFELVCEKGFSSKVQKQPQQS